jgi:hypothetical protein
MHFKLLLVLTPRVGFIGFVYQGINYNLWSKTAVHSWPADWYLGGAVLAQLLLLAAPVFWSS